MWPGLENIQDSGARSRLVSYLESLERWRSRINLTGAGDRAAVFATLVAPILGAEVLLSGRVVDVGSGNGSPGLVLASLRPDLSFVLLEPRAKRWAFLREAAREMGATNVEVERKRSDEYRGDPAETVTIRAVGLSPEHLRPLLGPHGGCVVVFGGPALEQTETVLLGGGGRVQRRCFT